MSAPVDPAFIADILAQPPIPLRKPGEPRQRAKNRRHADRLVARGGRHTTLELSPEAVAALDALMSSKRFATKTEAVSTALLAFNGDRLDEDSRLALQRLMTWWGIDSEVHAIALAVRWLWRHTVDHDLSKITVEL